MKTTTVLPILAILTAFAPVSLQAQPRLFVEAVALGDYDPTGYGTLGPIDDPPARTAGAGIGIGARLSPNHSLRFEMEFPAWHRVAGTWRSAFVDSVESGSERYAFRTTSYSIFVARELRSSGRFRLEALAGFSALTHSESDIFSAAIDEAAAVRPFQSDHHATERWSALSFGADAALSVTDHVAIVPELRLHEVITGTRGVLARPRIALRWRF